MGFDLGLLDKYSANLDKVSVRWHLQIPTAPANDSFGDCRFVTRRETSQWSRPRPCEIANLKYLSSHWLDVAFTHPIRRCEMTRFGDSGGGTNGEDSGTPPFQPPPRRQQSVTPIRQTGYKLASHRLLCARIQHSELILTSSPRSNQPSFNSRALISRHSPHQPKSSQWLPRLPAAAKPAPAPSASAVRPPFHSLVTTGHPRSSHLCLPVQLSSLTPSFPPVFFPRKLSPNNQLRERNSPTSDLLLRLPARAAVQLRARGDRKRRRRAPLLVPRPAPGRLQLRAR